MIWAEGRIFQRSRAKSKELCTCSTDTRQAPQNLPHLPEQSRECKSSFQDKHWVENRGSSPSYWPQSIWTPQFSCADSTRSSRSLLINVPDRFVLSDLQPEGTSLDRSLYDCCTKSRNSYRSCQCLTESHLQVRRIAYWFGIRRLQA